jgi:hypothetical protein
VRGTVRTDNLSRDSGRSIDRLGTPAAATKAESLLSHLRRSHRSHRLLCAAGVVVARSRGTLPARSRPHQRRCERPVRRRAPHCPAQAPSRPGAASCRISRRKPCRTCGPRPTAVPPCLGALRRDARRRRGRGQVGPPSRCPQTDCRRMLPARDGNGRRFRAPCRRSLPMPCPVPRPQIPCNAKLDRLPMPAFVKTHGWRKNGAGGRPAAPCPVMEHDR